MTTATSAAARQLGRIGWIELLGLTLVTGARNAGWRLLGGMDGAQGTDAALWGLSAEGLRHGAASPVPPLYPAVVALVRSAGLSLVDAGTAVSMVAGSLVPAAVVLAAHRLGADRRRALLAGVAALALPDLCAWSNELSPNSAVALAMVAVAGLWGPALRPEARGDARAAVLLTALFPMLRETGVVVALAAIALLLVGRRRGGRLAVALVALWWLSPLLAGAAPGPTPLSTPWGARGDMALVALAPGDGPLPNYVAEIPPADRGRYVAWLRDGAIAQVAAWHLRRSLRLAPGGWMLAVGCALLLVPRLRSRPELRAGLIPLATLAPACILWTQRRHVVLAAPALLAVLAAAATVNAAPARTGARRGIARVAGLALGLVGVLVMIRAWRPVFDEQRGAALRAATFRELGEAICAQDDPRPARLLGGPIQDVGLYCPLPRHDPDGSPADALTALVLPTRTGAAPLPPGWRPVGRRHADLQVHRLVDPPVQPCADAVPEPGTPYLSTGPVHARLVGCDPP